MQPIQNDQEFIQTMITQGRKKRKLDEADIDLPNGKIRRITIKAEPDQVRIDLMSVDASTMRDLAMHQWPAVRPVSAFP